MAAEYRGAFAVCPREDCGQVVAEDRTAGHDQAHADLDQLRADVKRLLERPEASPGVTVQAWPDSGSTPPPEAGADVVPEGPSERDLPFSRY